MARNPGKSPTWPSVLQSVSRSSDEAAEPADRALPETATVAHGSGIMKTALRLMLGLVLGLALFTASAAAAPIEPVDPTPDKPADFYVDVYPVLESKCIACHNRSTHESDLVLEDVASILKGGASGPAVVAGSPEKSPLYQLAARIDEPVMPPLPNRVGAKAVTPEQLGRLRRWILEGAQPGKSNPSASAIGWQALPSTMTASFALAIGPRERYAAVARANRVSICDLITGQEVAQLGDPLIRSVRTPSLLPLYDRDVAHFDVVSSLAFSPDGDWIASGGYREIKLWERQRNLVAVRIEAEKGVLSASVDRDGRRLLLGLEDGSLQLWDLETGATTATLGPVAGLSQAALSPDGSLALIATSEGALALWNLSEVKELHRWTALPPAAALAWSPRDRWFVTGHADGSLRRFNVPAEGPVSMEPAATQAASNIAVKSLQIVPDGSRIFVIAADGAVRSFNPSLQDPQEVRKFEFALQTGTLADSGTLAFAVPENGSQASLLAAGKQPAVAVSAVPREANQTRRLTDDLAVAGMQKNQAEEVVKKSEKEATERTESQAKAEKTRMTADEALVKAQKEADDSQAAVAKAQESLKEKPDDEALKKAVADAEAAAKKTAEALTAAREALSAAERGNRFAENAVQAARRELEADQKKLAERTTFVTELEKQLAAARESVEKSLVRITSIAISPGGKIVATGGSDGLVHLWAAQDGRWLETLTGHAAPVQQLAFASQDLLVSIDSGKSVLAWNLRPQWKLARVLGTKSESRLDIAESPLVDRVLALSFSPDGRFLASAGGEPSRGGELLIWETDDWDVQREFRELHSDTINAVAFSRDGKRLATGRQTSLPAPSISKPASRSGAMKDTPATCWGSPGRRTAPRCSPAGPTAR